MTEPDSDCEYSCQFLATECAVRDTLADLRHWLDRAVINPATQGTVELVLAEALNNIVEHAYANTRQGSVQMDVRHHQEQLQFELCDQGRPMPGHSLPEAMLPGTDVPNRDLPEGGFGWFLIHRLTSDLSYQRRADQNHLCFTIATNLHEVP